MATLPIARLTALTFTLLRATFAADEQWSREFFPAHSAYAINSMVASPDGRLFYAGRNLITENPGDYAVVAMQTGQLRLSIASGGGGEVFALAYDGQNLYAGGQFNTLSGYAVTNLARWDGAKWRQVGGGVSGGAVHAIAVKNGSIYVGGAFTNAGGVLLVGGLAMWDGLNWSSPGTARSTISHLPPVRALQFIGDSLFVGGCFHTIGGVAATNIAEYANGLWRPLGDGIDYGPGVRALAANSRGELFVGGQFYRPAVYVAKWNGVQWSGLGEGIRSESWGSVDALHCVGDQLYVAGAFRSFGGFVSEAFGGIGLARWDGDHWSNPNAPVDLGATAIAADPSNVYVAGPISSPMYNSGRPPHRGITHFDGARWHTPGGAEWPVVAGTVANGKLRAVSTERLDPYLQNIADWDGVNWNIIGTTRGKLIRQLAHKDGITYVIGEFFEVSGLPAKMIAAYDGASWRALGQGLSYPVRIDFLGSNLVAADDNGIHLWDGNAWQDLAPPFAAEWTALTADSNMLYVAGNRSLDNSTKTSAEVARWDGQQWTALGFQSNGGSIYSLCVSDGHLYAGGYFTNAGGAPAKMLAVFDDGTWRELGGGINTAESPWPHSLIRAIEPDGEGGVFVAGNFFKLGNTPANSICHWDGEEWRPLGQGILGGEIYNLRREGRDLYAFGLIDRAGGHPSSSIAKWRMADLELIPRPASANAAFNLEARGVVGSRFILQKSHDLQQWQNISTNTLTTKRLPLTAEPASPNPHYFRLVAN